MTKKKVIKQRAFTYLRVSSESQVQTDYDPDGLSIAAQREAAGDKAAQLGAEIVGEYSDPGRSAYADLHKRTGFLEMLDELARLNRSKATRIDYVIVWAVNRWARNIEDHFRTHALVKEAGAQLVSITEPMIGEGTPESFFVEGLFALNSQYDSMKTGRLVSNGLLQKAKSGGTYGPARLGYRNHQEELPDGRTVASVTKDEKRAPFITLAFQLYESGEYSISQLCAELDRLGLRTRPTKRSSGTKLGTSALQRLLNDPYYAGWIVYKRGTQDEQTFRARHEPLIDQETFDRVQAMLDERRVAGDRSQHRHHYLRGSVFCGDCGHRLTYAMSRSKTGKRYAYFFCTSRPNKRPCSMRSNIRPAFIEDAVARYYGERPVELTSEAISRRTAAIEDLAAVSQDAVVQVKEAKTALIAKLKAQQIRLLRLHAEEGDDVSPDAFRDERLRLQTEIDAAEQSLAETEQRLTINTDDLRVALELADDVAPVYERSDEKTKRSYNLAFFKKIYVLPEFDDRLECTGARVVHSELTEPYAVLLADNLAADVLAEAERITAGSTSAGKVAVGSTKREGDPGGPPSAPSSYFVKMAERAGFEPARELAPPTRLAGECLQPLGHLSSWDPAIVGGRARRRVPSHRLVLSLGCLALCFRTRLCLEYHCDPR
jgi:site-specific DNA recombinase